MDTINNTHKEMKGCNNGGDRRWATMSSRGQDSTLQYANFGL